MTESVKDAATGTDRDVSGPQVRLPVSRTYTYDTGKQMTFRSLGIDAAFSLLPGAAESISVVGDAVVMEFKGDVSTLGTIQALIASNPVAKEMIALSGDAGTIPLAWAGAAANLWNDLYATAAAMIVQDDEGHWAPFSGKSIVVEVKLDAFAAVPDSALSVGTDDGLISGAKKVQIVTADGTRVQQTDATKLVATVKQGTAADLKCEPTQADAAKLVVTAKQATAADLKCTEASAADIKTAVQEVASACATDRADAAPAEALLGGGKATDLTALPADVAAGKLVAFLADLKGILLSRLMLPIAVGGAAGEVVGTTGKLPYVAGVSHTINATGPKTVTVRELVGGVSWSVASGGGHSVLASGRAVTITVKNDDSTTTADVIADIAASATVSRLMALTGTAGDHWDHTLAGAGEALEYDGTIPAQVTCMRWPDGYFRPAEIDSTDGIKTSLSSLLFSEDGSRNVMRVERQGGETGRSAASAIVVPAGTTGRILGHVLEAGAGGATFNVRKDAVIGGAIIAQFVLAANTYDLRDWPDWPFGNGLYCEIAAGGGAFNFVTRNT
jgi:hypothetical protein